MPIKRMASSSGNPRLATRVVEAKESSMTAEKRVTGSGGESPSAMSDRTLLMITARYSCTAMLGYILSVAPGEAFCRSPSNGATPLHLANSEGFPFSPYLVRLLSSSYFVNLNALGLSSCRPGDLIPCPFPASPNSNPCSPLLLRSPLPSPSPSHSPLGIFRALLRLHCVRCRPMMGI